MSDAQNWKFHFTVTDLARFLGKSPVTLRHWERQGLVIFPRDNAGDRSVTTDEIRQVARIAKQLGRISEERLNMVEAVVTMLEMIERQNSLESIASGSARKRQNGTSPTAKRVAS